MDRLHVELINQGQEILDLEANIERQKNSIKTLQSKFSCIAKHMSLYRCQYLSLFAGLILVSSLQTTKDIDTYKETCVLRCMKILIEEF